MFLDSLRKDLKRNGLDFSYVIKGLVFPNSASALFWIRCFLWFETKRIPTFLPYRFLFHCHGLEFAKGCSIGPGLGLPHPFGVLFTEGTVIGKNCDIYGMVRFLRKYDKTPVVGDNVFIGDGVKIIGGCVLGNNVIVGAGAVVTKSFGNDVKLLGSPAREIFGKSS